MMQAGGNITYCEYCRPLFQPWKLPDSCRQNGAAPFDLIREWQPNMNSFKSSADSGCPLCAELWHEVIAEGWPQRDLWPLVRTFKARICKGWPLSQSVQYDREMWSNQWWMEFVAIVEKEATFEGASEGKKHSTQLLFGRTYLHPLRTDYTSPIPLFPDKENIVNARGLELAKEWLFTCLFNHLDCRWAGWRHENNFVPTRLIEVTQGSQTCKARIVDKGNVPPDVHYLTLSHRWGTGPMYTLRTDNLAEFKKEIPPQELPRTFRDAFKATLDLGHTFIWIDCLCILQDSSDDWGREVHRMADIYENAVCNLAASACAPSSTGLFPNDTLGGAKQLIVAIDVGIGEGIPAGLYELLPDNVWSSRVEKAPLNKRAWVKQEKFLSRRILHFGKDQLLWQCQRLRACEKWPRGLSPLISVDSVRSYHSIMGDAGLAVKARSFWYKIVCEYTQCALTYSSDKLPALRGITERFQEILQDRCIVGLWQKSLPSDLLWCRAWFEHFACPRAQNGRAPSWSWAAIDGCAYYALSRVALDLVAETISLDTNDDAHQRVSPSSLRIKAPLLKAICPHRMARFGSPKGIIRLKQGRYLLRLRYDNCPGDLDDLAVPAEQDTSVATAEDMDRDEGPLVCVYLLFVSEHPIAGLILKRVTGNGHYTRIGYFDEYFNAMVDPNRASNPLEPYLKDTHEIANDDYNEDHGEGSYTVTVV